MFIYTWHNAFACSVQAVHSWQLTALQEVDTLFPVPLCLFCLISSALACCVGKHSVEGRVFSSPWLAEPCSAVLASSCSFSCELFTAALNERSTPKLRPIPLNRRCDFFIHGMMRVHKSYIRYMHGTQQCCRRNSVAGGGVAFCMFCITFSCFSLCVKRCVLAVPR